jgi:hypothetical protein
MVKKIFAFSALIIVAAATVLVTPGTGHAQRYSVGYGAYQPYPYPYYQQPYVYPRAYQPHYGVAPYYYRPYYGGYHYYGRPRYYGVYPRTGYGNYGYRWR